MERSFARGTRYGFDRARWRGLWRVEIQEYLISAAQNIQILLRYGYQPKKSLTAMVNQVKGSITKGIRHVLGLIKGLNTNEMNQTLFQGFVGIGYIKS